MEFKEEIKKLVEKDILEELKGRISFGYTVSGQYSSRKVDNHTSIEYPITLDLNLVSALGDIQMVLNTHKSAIQAFQSKFITEEDFLIEMIPSYFTTIEVKEKIISFSKSIEKDPEILTKVNKRYFEIITHYYKEVAKNLNEFNIKEKVESMTVTSDDSDDSEDLLNS